ncbi:MAG: hypothetical protein IJ856_07340 [Candidatus Methanomethylophilaceae archaeon]|nr:hypothetical protein [Candidatus Methanomethylophilaceae archaeon]
MPNIVVRLFSNEGEVTGSVSLSVPADASLSDILSAFRVIFDLYGEYEPRLRDDDGRTLNAEETRAFTSDDLEHVHLIVLNDGSTATLEKVGTDDCDTDYCFCKDVDLCPCNGDELTRYDLDLELSTVPMRLGYAGREIPYKLYQVLVELLLSGH